MFIYQTSSAITHEFKDVKEHHDDVKVEDHGSNDVIIVVKGNTVVFFSSCDDSGINDQIESIDDNSQDTDKHVHGFSSHDHTHDQNWDGSQNDNDQESNEDLNWGLGDHSVYSQCDCGHSSNKSSEHDSLWWESVWVAGEASNHVGLADGECEQKYEVHWM